MLSDKEKLGSRKYTKHILRIIFQIKDIHIIRALKMCRIKNKGFPKPKMPGQGRAI